jgi:type VI secretion system protein ImpH
MVTQSRGTGTAYIDLLCAEGHRFEFFQAVRLLERSLPHRQPIGYFAAPDEEVVRFCAHLSAGFPPGPIYEIVAAGDDRESLQMVVAFMGLTGPMGVLPRHYTTWLFQRAQRRDHTLRAWLDIFNHRFVSLFYRAWEKYRFPFAYERAVRRQTGHDRFSQCLLALCSMGSSQVRSKLAIADETLMYYAGLFSRHPRSSSGLTSLLSDYFGVPVTVQQFVGRWLTIPAEERSRLSTGATHNILGSTTVLGQRVWQQHARFRLRLGPLSLDEYGQFLPTGDALRPLLQLTRLFVGHNRTFDLQLVLKRTEVPPCRLGATGSSAPRLGWTAWLPTRVWERDPDDTMLRDHQDAHKSSVATASADAA